MQNCVIPQLYRGYIYSIVGDEVCYYLGSRFYSPRLGRFLNADDIAYLGISDSPIGCNIYAYCINNPVNYIDIYGHNEDSILKEQPTGLLGAMIILMAALFAPQLFLPIYQNSSLPTLSFGTSSYLLTAESIDSWINSNIKTAEENLNSLEDSFGKSLSKEKKLVNKVISHIANKLSKLKKIPSYKSNEEVHHIVAQNATRAITARKYLAGVQLNTEFYLNKIPLKTFLHKRLHTNAYYQLVNNLMECAYKTGDTIKEKRTNVIAVIFAMRVILISLNEGIPF